MTDKTLSNTDFHTVITAKKRRFDINLKEIWRYRDLIWLFTKRNFILIYKQTILGPAWIVLQPLMTTLIFTVVFGGIAGIATDGVPQLLFYMGGTAVWTFFSGCLNKTSTTFVSNAAVYGKVYFPRLVTPISNVLSSSVDFCVQLVMFLCFWVFYVITGQVNPNYWGIVLLPLVMLYLGLLSLGLGIIISSMTTKYRDLTLLVGFGVQLWMYITPVVYPVSGLDNGLLRTVVMINPVTCAVEAFRWMFLGSGSMDPINWVVSVATTVVLLFGGILIFNRVEKTFMDTV